VTTDLRSQPQELQRAAKLRGLEPARHSAAQSSVAPVVAKPSES
jgi:hypothetical protein